MPVGKEAPSSRESIGSEKGNIVLWPLGDGILCTIVIKNMWFEVRPALESWLCHTY